MLRGSTHTAWSFGMTLARSSRPLSRNSAGSRRATALSVSRSEGSAATLAVHDGSLYSFRSRVEPLVEGDEPQAVVLYLPGETRDSQGSVLMEGELAGCRWEPQLRQLARNALRMQYTEGVIDELLGRERVTYEDLLVASTAEGAAPPSVLSRFFVTATSEGQLASWLAKVDLDDTIEEKEAASELARLSRRAGHRAAGGRSRRSGDRLIPLCARR